MRARLNLNPAHWGVRAIAEIGVAVALAAALSWIAQAFPLRMPQGGSFGLEMLPILFIALRRGVVPGVVAGALFGLLQLAGVAGTPYIYHPLQAALDYPLAFAALGLAGLVPIGELHGARGVARLTAAVAAGTGLRFLCHFLSGLIFFAEYAPAWEAPWLYSITYNLLYLLPSAVVTALVLWPLLRAYDAAFPGPTPVAVVSLGAGSHAGRALAAVFLDGEYGDASWYRALATRADILLAADGGAAFLLAAGVRPEAVVGDFDSLDDVAAAALRAQGVEFVRHPVRKDVTDGELAVEEALRRGAGALLLAGATGALDHTLGHLAILRRLAERGVAARMVAPDLAVTVLVAPAEVVLAAPAGVRVSLAPVRRRRDRQPERSRVPARPRGAAGGRVSRSR